MEIVSASTPMSLDEYADAIGDALMIYSDQGFMIRQPVPADVAEAYRRLRQAGFTSRFLSNDSPSV
ncbi:hypothetical protein [Streptomyces sp. wa22]|uniref:hypothetical protein n=1 Tax=Streptomyces sp. wa22 TaxID=1828244 RepID=UPI0039677EAB